MTSIRSIFAAAVAAFLVASAARAQDASGYHLVKKIPIGTDGGWDYALVDAEAGRLYVSHGTRAVVIDLTTDSVIGEVTPSNGMHGIAVAHEFNRGFTSNGRDTTVTIFDLTTLAALGSVTVTGANPDAIVYDDASKRVFTFNGRGSQRYRDRRRFRDGRRHDSIAGQAGVRPGERQGSAVREHRE